MTAAPLDFYIAVYAQFASRAEVWLVYKGECSTSCCVGSYATEQQATDHAIRMAEYHAGGGQRVLVHRQNGHAGPERWTTIWQSEDARG